VRLTRSMSVLLRDEAGATTIEYVVAAVALVFAAIVIFASRPIARILGSFFQSVNTTATQAVP
jgi:Flp pilus assembly pilin Flp